MAYLTLAELQDYLDIESSTENVLLEEAIDDAQSYIENETDRYFEAQTVTRYYTLDDVEGQVLHLNNDLLTITTLTNGDSSATAITSGYYWLLPRNDGPPYHQIQLTTNDGYYWEQDGDYWISVAGTWGYTASVPGDIRRAPLVLAAYFYRQKDTQVFDVVAVPEAGVITIPQGIPATVQKVIAKYRRAL
jgi:hypothetical protein